MNATHEPAAYVGPQNGAADAEGYARDEPRCVVEGCILWANHGGDHDIEPDTEPGCRHLLGLPA